MAANRHEELVVELRELVERVLLGTGVELVELSLRGSSRRRNLRLDIDRAGASGVGLEDCKRVSDLVGAELEHEDPIRDSFVLEVSSPGIDRPIATADDIRRNTGRRIVVRTSEPWEGQREFRGVLLGCEADALKLHDEGREPIFIPLKSVEKAQQDVAL